MGAVRDHLSGERRRAAGADEPPHAGGGYAGVGNDEAMIRKSDLPFGSEFSPSQIVLPELLEMIEVHQGQPRALENAILMRYFSQHSQLGTTDEGDYNRAKLANNCKLGLIAYRIIDREAGFTGVGRSLYELRHDEVQLYEALAQHILLRLNGMNLVQCIQDMRVAGEDINLTSLREGLAARGIHYPPGGKHPSMMRLWLAKAGVFIGKGWQIDDLRLRAVLGTEPEQFETLANFTAEQRAFLRALANTGKMTPQPANEIARLATATYGIKFPEKSLPKLVLNALMEAGYITADKTTTGRGARPFLIAPTEKLILEIIEPLLEQLVTQTDPKLRQLLRKSLAEILIEVESPDRHIAGLALEALAFKLMRLIDMEYLATRLRGTATGGAEVDLLFHSTRLVYSRWQIQCKNTERVSLDDVAKEVGLTQFLNSSAIVMVSTGTIGSEARRYANRIMAQSNLAIIMIDGGDLKHIMERPAAIIDIFEREAIAAMKLKSLDLEK
jgi:site-specific DNA-methyltransferase (cytosine-N4-specific)